MRVCFELINFNFESIVLVVRYVFKVTKYNIDKITK